MVAWNTETSEIISKKSYIGTLVIGIIPIIGTIMLIKWGKDTSVRESKQNLCKAFIIVKYILIVPITIIVGVFSYIIGTL